MNHREVMSAPIRPVLHRDGTVTYWSVYEQRWEQHQVGIPDHELAALSPSERKRVQAHLSRSAAAWFAGISRNPKLG